MSKKLWGRNGTVYRARDAQTQRRRISNNFYVNSSKLETVSMARNVGILMTLLSEKPTMRTQKMSFAK